MEYIYEISQQFYLLGVKFDKTWRNGTQVHLLPVSLDPRHKMFGICIDF